MSENEKIFFLDEITESEKNIRLDKFLAQKLPEISRSQIQRLIEAGNVLNEDVIISDNSYKTAIGDTYQIIIPPAQDALPKAENIPLDVIYEDNDLIVINKPAGMTVHPAPGAYNGTLVNALLFHCKDNLSGIGGVKRPGIVHRIDKETSGLLVVAKNDKAHQGLSEQFAEHSIERTYWAIVYGVPQELSGRIEGNIARSNTDRKKMTIAQERGKPAITNYKTLKIFKMAASLIQCNLETGRTHQIRVHMSSLGHSLVGDKVYVKNKKSSVLLPSDIKKYVNEFPRQALHAKSLGFIHPCTKEYMHFDSELPSDLHSLVDKLSSI
jgi:23S rRNA pseudouridine1911/1915/1917 synthase